MKFTELQQKLKDLRIFSTKDITIWDDAFRLANLDRWEAEGKIVQLKRGWYMFSDFDLTEKDHWLIANRIYSPSYISLESALSYYGVIPEAVRQVTSITTNKTLQIENSIGEFQYYSIKNSLNFGYIILDHLDQGIKIAHLEKSLLDLFYLRDELATVEDLNELRLNNEVLVDTIDFDRLHKYGEVFGGKNIKDKIRILEKYIHA